MITVRAAHERGHAHHGWLESDHSFSFADYYDPRHMGVSALRVINDDRVAPGAGFPTHGHRDMEIISYVTQGGLEHKDSMGNGSVIRPGEIQRMSAGTGILHSEYNASDEEEVRFLQIWIMPDQRGVTPGYQQQKVDDRIHGGLALLASPDGRDESVRIHQDAFVYGSRLQAGQQVKHGLAARRVAYLHVVGGEVELNDRTLRHGDAATIRDENIRLSTASRAEVLLFDLP